MNWLWFADFLKRKSLLITLLTLSPILAIILGLTACVQHPVGDSERSRVDHRYVGMWLAEETDDVVTLLLLRPYDARTYLAGVFRCREEDGAVEPVDHHDYKAWLTQLGGETFVTMEPLIWAEFVGLAEKPPYLVGKIRLIDDALRLRLVDGGSEPAKSAADSGELEAVIEKHVAQDALYVDDPVVFHKMDDTSRIERILKAFQEL